MWDLKKQSPAGCQHRDTNISPRPFTDPYHNNNNNY